MTYASIPPRLRHRNPTATSLRTLALGAALVIFPSCERKATPSTSTSPAAPVPAVLSPSSRCAACHQDATAVWKKSQHALAHRDLGTAVDAEAFAGHEITLGDAHWRFSGAAEDPKVSWSDPSAAGSPSVTESPSMAIGLTPLVQYLLHTGDGRYQVPDMAWDPELKEWFSVYGDQNRRPEEWGHWTQRGMNWNSQCAYCHFTGFEKNHDPVSDGYHSAWIEQGVGCAQCHGPDRPDRGGGDNCLIDPAKKFTPEQWLHSCATCHSRREELDEKFRIGDSFFDHYQLALPDQPGLWHPDGQQIDEDYNFTSLLLSRMGHKGITCTDCHDPHAAAPKGGMTAVRSDALCLTCHSSGDREATLIDPATHTFHAPGTPGASCVDCHMPKTTYMGRDPRSDHRFPRPDPLLTKELGTPNACNDCHSDKGLDWQIEWTDKWYGEKMETPARTRTRALAAAQHSRPGALDLLLTAFDAEEIDAWKATLLRLMGPWSADSRVAQRANRAATDPGPLTRGAAASLIARRPESGALLDQLLNDPLKSVRAEAAWGALERLPADSPAVREIAEIALHQADQPGGAMRMARLAVARRDGAEAEKWFKRAAAWDQTSGAPRRDFAVYLSGLGRTAESVGWLDEAARLDPANAEIPYLAALAHAELGQMDLAETRFVETVRLRPDFARAWYNLGLLQNSRQDTQAAIQSLIRAENADLTSPDAPYARATIQLRLGEVQQALDAAGEALRRDPSHAPSRQLLDQLGR